MFAAEIPEPLAGPITAELRVRNLFLIRTSEAALNDRIALLPVASIERMWYVPPVKVILPAFATVMSPYSPGVRTLVVPPATLMLAGFPPKFASWNAGRVGKTGKVRGLN